MPEEARIIQRAFRAFIEGKAITDVAKEPNEERVATKVRLRRRLECVERVGRLKDEKDIEPLVWNRTTRSKSAIGENEAGDRPPRRVGRAGAPGMRVLSAEQWDTARTPMAARSRRRALAASALFQLCDEDATRAPALLASGGDGVLSHLAVQTSAGEDVVHWYACAQTRPHRNAADLGNVARLEQ